MRGIKVTNEYSQVLGPIYGEMPKAVMAALVVSLCGRCSFTFAEIPSAVMDEWQVLFENGIVTQRPPADLRVKFAGTSRTPEGE